MADIQQTERASKILNDTLQYCMQYRHEFVMPEHLLMRLTDDDNFRSAMNIFYSPDVLRHRLKEKMETLETVPEGRDYVPETSVQMSRVLEIACQQVYYSSAKAVDTPHLVMGLLHLDDSWACYLMKDALYGKESNFMANLINFYDFDDRLKENFGEEEEEDEQTQPTAAWQRLVSCMNDRRRQGPADWPRGRAGAHHPGAVPPRQEQPAARRRTGRRQDGTRLGTGAPHQGGQRPTTSKR